VAAESAGSEGAFFLPKFEFDGSMIVAFLFCYIALLINDISSIQSLGAMLDTDSLQSRCRRGVGFTGLFNILAGCLGVIGPVNYSMSPGVIASSSCASRYALVPAGLGLVVCACVPDLIAVLSAIPNSVIGVILLYLMGTQLAASFAMMTSSGKAISFEDCLVVGLPVMAALVFGVIPINIVPTLLRPIVGNGFVMGVILVILLEHVIIRRK
jgi:xanthine/uracil permease